MSPTAPDILVLAANLAPELETEEVEAIEAEAEIEVAAAPDIQANGAELGLFSAVNADRAQHGLPPLEWAPQLLDIARQRAQAQVDQPSLDHYDTSGQLAFVVLFQESGIRYRRAGENLARIGGSDATRVQRAESALMESPTHRANILEGTYQGLAVGAGRDSRGNSTFAQIFINP